MRLFRKNTNKIKVMALGGLNEIGKNMTVIEYKDEIIVIDAGMSFPDDEMLGVDVVIPDISYLIKNKDKIKGIFITHGHEDHIGALPYILKKINIPIYGAKLSIGLIQVKLKEHKINNAKLTVVSPRDIIKLSHMEVEFIKNNHSIPDACSIAVHTDQGIIYHTGDFKIDLTPIDGEVMDIHRICELSKKGVLLLLAESTNAEQPGSTMSEKTVGAGLDDLFRKASNSRIIVATFASNIHRLQQIINTAEKFNRKVAVSGRSMVNVVAVATELGYLNIPDNMLIDLNDISKYEDNEVVLITTGSQGEPMSALARMASAEHKKVEIKRGDLIIISAHPIPGNEKLISKVINSLFEKYEITLDQAIEMKDDNLDVDKRYLENIRKEIRNLGNVNLDSIKEYEHIKERHDFYSEQKKDLEQSIEVIEKLIYELEENMKKEFESNFNKINENFKFVYKRLFGGGNGELKIVDKNNILESDIEITAQPPGKKMKNLNLLSGGEKALTAISILFSIILAKPTPFCILDEIEAPLDDANIFRFGEFLKELSNDTQFISVTHRRGTMEAADYIYGVTMQEKAISKVLSLKLKEAEEIIDAI